MARVRTVLSKRVVQLNDCRHELRHISPGMAHLIERFDTRVHNLGNKGMFDAVRWLPAPYGPRWALPEWGRLMGYTTSYLIEHTYVFPSLDSRH
ncbi:unnamed protein product [Oppiella nova]|uniref:Uncharacterized protein n=1 Tax=Oppiella nova TaxID=334625 RepID=A0A7R9QDY4_9ACAR|nr:unnamed protein product [Oppiella nova]CAG2163962.1 unnamed protein product [Oppiella nova]